MTWRHANTDHCDPGGAGEQKRHWNTCGMTRERLEAKWLAGRSP